jgi:ABC-2 type transport system ATP-binding protein
MQNRFVELILEEKKKGKTILMSSHMFEEVERACDNVLIIKDGKIVVQSDVIELKNSQRKGFIIKPADMTSSSNILQNAGFEIGTVTKDSIEIFITGEKTDLFIKTAAQFKVLNLEIKAQSLEDIFMQFYGKEGK